MQNKLFRPALVELIGNDQISRRIERDPRGKCELGRRGRPAISGEASRPVPGVSRDRISGLRTHLGAAREAQPR